MQGTSINRNVDSYGPGPTRAVALPAAPATPEYEVPLLDRVGDVIRDQTWLPALGAGIGGAGAGALAIKLARGLPFRYALPIMAGVPLVGAVAGVAAALTAGVIMGDKNGRPAVAPTAPVADPSVVADEKLRVMTFNVHGGMGPGGTYFTSDEELDRVAAAIHAEDPDVVMLQELDRFGLRSNWTDTLAELSRRLDPDGAVYTPRGTMSNGQQEGTGIMTFNGVEIADARAIVNDDPIGGSVKRRLTTAVSGTLRMFSERVLGRETTDGGTPDYFPRVTTDVMLVTPEGNRIRALSGHYNGPREGLDYQGHQVAPVAGLVGAWDGPTLWGADWNVRSATIHGVAERRLLADAGMRDAFSAVWALPGDSRRNSSGNKGKADIDRVYVSDQFGVDSVRVVPFAEGEPDPSDHHAVVTDVHLEAPATR